MSRAGVHDGVCIYIQSIEKVALQGLVAGFQVSRYVEVLGIDMDKGKECIVYIPLDRPNGVGYHEIKPGQTIWVDCLRVFAVGHGGIRLGYEVLRYSPRYEIEELIDE